MQFLFRDAVAGENLRGEAPGKLQNEMLWRDRAGAFMIVSGQRVVKRLLAMIA